MKLRHEEIMEMLPEYQRGHVNSDIRNDMEMHMKECQDCRDILSLISRLQRIEVPDPGDLFWKTLPQKVRVSVEKPKVHRFSVKAVLFGPLSIAVTAVILIFIFFAHTNKKVADENDLLINDSFDEAIMDYSNFNERDIRFATNEVLGRELSGKSDDFAEYAYDEGLDVLSEKDLNSLNEVLKREQQAGG